MTPSAFLDLWQRSLLLLLVLALPTIAAAGLVALVWMVLKDLIGLRETGRGIIPKLIAILLAFVITAPWIIDTLTQFARYLLAMTLSR